ncbi:hypothetical protein P3S67_002911 [Capsicum chacoense]
MQKCVVHFVPLNKQIPKRKEHPGYFVQKVYDAEQRTLFKLTDEDYEDTKQHEIDLLVQKTIARVGHLPDLETEDNSAAPYFCNPVDNVLNDGKEKRGSDAADLTGNTDSAKHVNESLDNSADGDVFRWPDSVVPAVVSLEKAAHEALSSDFQNYNQKMRQ